MTIEEEQEQQKKIACCMKCFDSNSLAFIDQFWQPNLTYKTPAPACDHAWNKTKQCTNNTVVGAAWFFTSIFQVPTWPLRKSLGALRSCLVETTWGKKIINHAKRGKGPSEFYCAASATDAKTCPGQCCATCTEHLCLPFCISCGVHPLYTRNTNYTLGGCSQFCCPFSSHLTNADCPEYCVEGCSAPCRFFCFITPPVKTISIQKLNQYTSLNEEPAPCKECYNTCCKPFRCCGNCIKESVLDCTHLCTNQMGKK